MSKATRQMSDALLNTQILKSSVQELAERAEVPTHSLSLSLTQVHDSSLNVTLGLYYLVLSCIIWFQCTVRLVNLTVRAGLISHCTCRRLLK